MRVIVAECSAIYSGRGDSSLARGLRAIFIKSDGSVSIHNDSSNKPMNYMKTASQTVTVNEAGEEIWTFDARHESLRVTVHKVYASFEQELLGKENDPGLTRDGTEAHLQEWLFAHPDALGPGYLSVEREFNTGAGAVDILAITPQGIPVAVEVKRVAMLGAVDQIQRYVESMKLLPNLTVPDPQTQQPIELDFQKTIGLVAALDLRPKMLALADKRSVPTVEIPAYWREARDS
jgi:RecB family endonuclease NucS